MRVAIESIRALGAWKIIIAIPTAPARTALDMVHQVDAVYCPNLRYGPHFAVADAYNQWYDVSEKEALAWLDKVRHVQ